MLFSATIDAHGNCFVGNPKSWRELSFVVNCNALPYRWKGFEVPAKEIAAACVFDGYQDTYFASEETKAAFWRELDKMGDESAGLCRFFQFLNRLKWQR